MTDPPDDGELREKIAQRAYLRYCDRGRASGCDMDDWLAAESEVLAEKEHHGPRERLRPKQRVPRKNRT